jgi:hypothetical protein
MLYGFGGTQFCISTQSFALQGLLIEHVRKGRHTVTGRCDRHERWSYSIDMCYKGKAKGGREYFILSI